MNVRKSDSRGGTAAEFCGPNAAQLHGVGARKRTRGLQFAGALSGLLVSGCLDPVCWETATCVPWGIDGGASDAEVANAHSADAAASGSGFASAHFPLLPSASDDADTVSERPSDASMPNVLSDAGATSSAAPAAEDASLSSMPQASADAATLPDTTVSVGEMLHLPVVETFSASVAELPGGGGATTLSWSVIGADSVRIDPDIGTVSGTSLDVSVSRSTTFTLTAHNADGDTTRDVTVEVSAQGTLVSVSIIGSLEDEEPNGGNSTDEALAAVATDKGVFFIGTGGALDVPDVSGAGASFIARYASGEVRPVRQFDYEAFNILADANGELIVLGLTDGDADGVHGSNTELSPVVGRYSSTLQLISLMQFEPPGLPRPVAMTVDADGNVLVAGATVDNLDGAHPSNVDGDAFVAKFSGVGDLLWLRQVGTSDAKEQVGAVAVGPDGEVVISGTTKGDLDGEHANSSSTDAFVVKITADGQSEQWLKQNHYDVVNAADAIGVSALGEVYVAGYQHDSNGWPNRPGVWEAYLTKYSAAGDVEWKRVFGAPDYGDIVNALAFDVNGNIFLTGRTYGELDIARKGQDGYLVKYTPDGEQSGPWQLNTEESSVGVGLACDMQGNVVVVGSTHDEISNEPFADVVLARFR